MGIKPEIIVQDLNVDHTRKLVQQRKRRFVREKSYIIKSKLDSLKWVGWVWEIDYPTLLSNVFLANKAKSDHDVCRFHRCQYTHPKGLFSLSNIDQLVDSTVIFQVLSFMDAYLGYLQIRMHLKDEENTLFITKEWIFC